jgi:hypothetical protein
MCASCYEIMLSTFSDPILVEHTAIVKGFCTASTEFYGEVNANFLPVSVENINRTKKGIESQGTLIRCRHVVIFTRLSQHSSVL